MGEKINRLLKGEIVSSVFYILLGLCLILIPTQTVDVICKIVFGLILIGVGIYHIYIYIRGKETATIMDLLSGVVVFVLGVFLFMTPSIVIKLLPWMLSAFVLVDSLWKLKGGFLLKKGGHGEWSVLLIGSLVFIALGIVMLFGRFPKIMTLLIFSGWVLVCNGAADIVFFIIMKLGLRKIAKNAEAGKEESGADRVDSVNDQADPKAQNEKDSEPQSGKETAQENSTDSDFTSENETESAATPVQDTEDSVDEKEAEKPKEPENLEMKLLDAGKDQVETGSLKELLDDSDEDLEEWKD